MVVEGQDAASGRDIQVHSRQVSVLSQGHQEVAELTQAQSIVQRLFHQGGFFYIEYTLDGRVRHLVNLECQRKPRFYMTNKCHRTGTL